ncbi:TPA: hypothetical protein QDB45_001729 [Burkholderia vietnamiensis]|nr:hypothetical protein [Burkholderia vietnamiensis]
MEHTFFKCLWIIGGVAVGVGRYVGKRRLLQRAVDESRGNRTLDQVRKDLEKAEFYRQSQATQFDQAIAEAESDNDPDRAQHLKYQKDEALESLDRSIKQSKDILAGRAEGHRAPSLMGIVPWVIGGCIGAFIVGTFA